jgi:predicted GNAT family acetyltransferase
VRRLDADDASHVARLSPSLAWIAATWGSPASLATSGYAWGAFVDQRLCSLACSFFVGERYEDVGVVTEAVVRGQGLSTACAAGLCGDILGRGRRPSWSTSLDNTASRRVAKRLGFVEQRRDRLLLSGGPASPA